MPALERYLHHVTVDWPSPDETAATARLRLADRFPRTALRRMTHLGLLVGHVLEGADLGPSDAVVYATTFAEARALEEYLVSFPAASPLLFQTSIHPGGVQQVLIPRQQSIARLWPMAGGERLVEQSLLAVLLEPAARVGWVGGEEKGTWLCDHGMASPLAFAFCARVSADPTGAIGRIGCSPEEEGDDPCPSLATLARALRDRQPLSWRSAGTCWRIEWS